MAQNFQNFCDGFAELVAPAGAPRSFSLWTSLWLVGAAVERRVFAFTSKGDTWANTFIFLVAPPGYGKGLVIEPARRLLRSLGAERISPSSMTQASFADELKDGHRTVIDTKTQISTDYYGINVTSPELQVLFPVYDQLFQAKLTDLWDGKEYSERRRHGKGEYDFKCERTYCSLIGGTTPEHLVSTFPESAYRTGFFSRTFLVFGQSEHTVGLFDNNFDLKEMKRLEKALAEDLLNISQIQGQVGYSEAAKEFINSFSKAGPLGGDPIPKHPRLMYYATRRAHHLLKISMLLMLSHCKSDLIITEEIVHVAYDILIEMEAEIPLIFQDMDSGGDTQTLSDLHYDLLALFRAEKGKPISRAVVINAFTRRLPSYKVHQLLDLAVAGGWFKEHKAGIGQPIFYEPVANPPTSKERRLK